MRIIEPLRGSLCSSFRRMRNSVRCAHTHGFTPVARLNSHAIAAFDFLYPQKPARLLNKTEFSAIIIY